MSGFAGIMWFTGRPAGPDLASLLEPIRHRGDGTRRTWTSGSVGFAITTRFITPESKDENQPATDAEGNCVVFDGRIDYRDELLKTLSDKGVAPRDRTDAELVLCAYRAWGAEAARFLEGDYSFVIFDARQRSLYCVRDRIGMKPFYYAHTADFFAFASEPASLFAISGFNKRPNKIALLRYLMNFADDIGDTEFEGVHRLPPAHWMVVKEGRVDQREYWDVDPLTVNYRRDPREYQEEFRGVFTSAVTQRMRAIGPLGAFLSGGIDSSSVMGVMHQVRQKRAPDTRIISYSLIFPGKPFDEQPYMRAVVERSNSEVRWVEQPPPVPLWEVGPFSDAAPLVSPLAYTVRALATEAAKDGCRVTLGGVGGDDFLDAPPILGFDLLRGGHPVKAFRYLSDYARFQNLTTKEALAQTILTPLRATVVPRSARKIYRRIRPVQPREWLHPKVRKIGIELLREPVPTARNPHLPLARRSTYGALHSGHLINALEHNDRFCTRLGLENPQPFCDARVVEQAMSIPDLQLARNGRPKGLLRDAMAAHLPEIVKNRVDKAEFLGLFVPRLVEDHDEAERLLRDPILESLGIVDGKSVRRRYEWFREAYMSRYSGLTSISGRNNMLPSDEIWLVLNLEAWTRRTFA